MLRGNKKEAIKGPGQPEGGGIQFDSFEPSAAVISAGRPPRLLFPSAEEKARAKVTGDVVGIDETRLADCSPQCGLDGWPV